MGRGSKIGKPSNAIALIEGRGVSAEDDEVTMLEAATVEEAISRNSRRLTGIRDPSGDSGADREVRLRIVIFASKGKVTIPARFEPETMSAIEEWADQRGVSRSEAIRRLVEMELKAKK